jgi:hypothetical protein
MADLTAKRRNFSGRIVTLTLVGLLVAVTGCQTGQPAKTVGLDNGSFMGLWSTYSHCQASSNLDELRQDVVTLAGAANRSSAPGAFVLPLPGKLERYVTSPSARLAVDVNAMGAACSLRAGQIAVEAGKLDVAREFLQAVLHNHPQSDYAYYTSQAKALLSDLDTQVVQVTLNVR